MDRARALELRELCDRHTSADVKRMYRRLVLTAHPDKGGDENAFAELNNAYEFLCHEAEKREVHDNIVHLARCVPHMCLPAQHPMYKWTTEAVYQYICNTEMQDYGDECYQLPPEDSRYMIVGLRGKDVRKMSPSIDNALMHLFSFDIIRPAAQYVLVVEKV